MSVALLLLLEAIADTASVEHYRCLYADRWGGPLVTAVQPVIQWATVSSIAFEPCPDGALAEWHNHLAMAFATTGEPRGRVPPAAMCYLSHVDTASAFNEQYLSVARGTSCRFLRTDSGWVKSEVR